MCPVLFSWFWFIPVSTPSIGLAMAKELIDQINAIDQLISSNSHLSPGDQAQGMKALGSSLGLMIQRAKLTPAEVVMVGQRLKSCLLDEDWLG